jgi:hypothetical protein
VTPAASPAKEEKKQERVPLTAEQKTKRTPALMKKLQGKKDEHKKGYDKIMNKYLDALDGGSTARPTRFSMLMIVENVLFWCGGSICFACRTELDPPKITSCL